MVKVLVVATSRKTRGGITSVILAHEEGRQWNDYHCCWIETHRDKSKLVKIIYFLRAFFLYVFLMPQYDIVHIHLSEPPSAIRKLPFMWWAKVWRKKTIAHFHSFSPDTTVKSRWASIYAYLFGKADTVIALSPYWKREIISAFPQIEECKICVIYNPCTCEQYTDIYEKKNTILYAGSVIARKGYVDLIMAFARIADSYKTWNLVLAGNGEIDKAKAIAEDLGIEERIDFTGWIKGRDKDRAFKEATVFCLPSYAEGFPMAVLDAWAYGLPVIATPVGGLPDIAVDENNVLFFPVGNIDALSRRLEQIITDQGLRTKLSAGGLKLSTTVFDKQTIASQLGDLYSTLVG